MMTVEDLIEIHHNEISEIVESVLQSGKTDRHDIASMVRARIYPSTIDPVSRFDADGITMARFHAYVTKMALRRIERVEYERRLNENTCCFNCRFWLDGGIREVGPGRTEQFGPICRRFPQYEKRNDNDYCGEWKKGGGIRPLEHGGSPMTLRECMEAEEPTA